MPRINSAFTSRVRNPGGATLLDYLARRFDYHPREEWARLLDLGRLELDGRPARAGDALREGQQLRFAVVEYDEPEVPVDFKVLEPSGEAGGLLADLAFVHKPAGMPVHRTGRIFFQTLANLARQALGGPEDRAWAPLNRLDRETSGVVAFARGPEAFRALGPSSPGATWTKLYAAIVRGGPSGDRAFRLDSALGERPGDAIRCRMHPFAPGEPAGKPALSVGCAVARKGDTSLLVLSPITGRKHQLRAHLAAAGWPVVGDKIYADGGRAYLAQVDGNLGAMALEASRHLLHAFHLRIDALPDAGGREAWDWDAGEEFEARHPLAAVGDWLAGEWGRSFLAEVRAARGDLRRA